jgi:hypothetical protein
MQIRFRDVFIANLEDKIKQIIEPLLFIRGERDHDKIVPAKLFERICPQWRALT